MKKLLGIVVLGLGLMLLNSCADIKEHLSEDGECHFYCTEAISNKNFVEITVVSSMQEALPYAEKHCAKFGRTAKWKKDYIFYCVE